ncbi:MAG: hypothetical protein O9262_11560 [Cyclobacteriaceae bacterium]|nr:hypothetical protein [Cyclobacteriaceae bacterium]
MMLAALYQAQSPDFFLCFLSALLLALQILVKTQSLGVCAFRLVHRPDLFRVALEQTHIKVNDRIGLSIQVHEFKNERAETGLMRILAQTELFQAIKEMVDAEFFAQESEGQVYFPGQTNTFVLAFVHTCLCEGEESMK